MNPSSKLFNFEENIITAIAQQYERTKNSLSEDVENLKTWMKSQPHLPEILDNKTIQNFLILNKCSVERAKERIDMYYTIRSQIPDLYECINPTCSNVKKIAKLVNHVPLPKMTKKMYRVFVFNFSRKEMMDEIDPNDILRYVANLQEIRLKEDVMYGDIFIYDMKGTTLGYLSKLTPVFMAKALAIYKQVYSIPLKGMYIVNSVPYMSAVLAIMKRILKPKLFERIHVCNDTSILREHFPLEILPRDYGGEEKSIEELNELCERKFEQYQTRFDVLDKLRVNENLRPTKLRNDDTLGYYGNFKKLVID